MANSDEFEEKERKSGPNPPRDPGATQSSRIKPAGVPVRLDSSRSAAAKEKAGQRESRRGPDLHPNRERDPSATNSKDNRATREERIACSFPGLLKILVPEKSFVPYPLACRVVNLSASGAMVEVHEQVHLDREMMLTNRFFELKVAHPDIPDLRGSVAWSDMGAEKPNLGLSCFERRPELAAIVDASASAVAWEGPPALPSPQIDPFPPVTQEQSVKITGHAPEALMVMVRKDDERWEVPVNKGRFRVTLELQPGSENMFTVRSQAGERRSRTVPISITCEKGMKTRRFYFDTRLKTSEKTGDQRIELEFNGNVRQAERVLYRFSQLLAMSERVTISAELSSPTGFDQRLFETLRAEGAVLAADTTRNQMAAKLLDELL